MNETNERELNLMWLLYRVLRGWKSIIIWTIVGALVAGVAGFGLVGLKLIDDEYMEEAQQAFDRKHAAWWAMKEDYRIRLEKLEESKARQEEYNEKSIMMDIDPMKKTVASFELYVKYDYTIDPNLTVQNPDLSNRILRSYATYMTNGEMYQYIMNNLDYEIEMRYLTEILGISVDYSNNFITVSVVHVDDESCQQILTLARTGIESRTAQIAADIDEHSISLSNQTSYETIDNGLKDAQEANIKAVTDIDTSINALNQARLKWEAGDVEPAEGQDEDDVLTGIEPVFEYSPMEIAKDVLKKAIIGAAVGFVLPIVYLCVISILSGKLLNPEDMKTRFGLRVIGLLPTDNTKRAVSGLSAQIAKLGGVKIKQTQYPVLAKMIGSSIASEAAGREGSESWKTIAFTGTGTSEEMEKAVAAMGITGYSVVCAPGVLTDSASIDKVAAADCVVLVEAQEKAAVSDIEKELEALAAWKKPVLGAVVLNGDAIK